MSHPFFDVSRYPFERAEGRNFHETLYKSFKEERDAKYFYDILTGGIPPLPPMLAANELWKVILNNLTTQGLLEKLCAELENKPINTELRQAIKKVREAKQHIVPPQVDHAGIWNRQELINPTPESVQEFKGKWANFVLTSAILSGLLLGAIRILLHLVVLEQEIPSDQRTSLLLSFSFYFAVGAFFAGIVAAAMSGVKLLILMKLLTTVDNNGILSFSKNWFFSLLVFLAGASSILIVIQIIMTSRAPVFYRLQAFLLSFGLISGIYLSAFIKKKHFYSSYFFGIAPPAIFFFIYQFILNTKIHDETSDRIQFAEANYFFLLQIGNLVRGLAGAFPELGMDAVLRYAQILSLLDTTLAGIIFFTAITIANLKVSQPEYNYLFN